MAIAAQALSVIGGHHEKSSVFYYSVAVARSGSSGSFTGKNPCRTGLRKPSVGSHVHRERSRIVREVWSSAGDYLYTRRFDQSSGARLWKSRLVTAERRSRRRRESPGSGHRVYSWPSRYIELSACDSPRA